jgi:DNA-binding LacI/PurR family transcriptional regulator
VAQAAGVGRQTVSNVLNDSGRVGEATKVRVLEAVATLGYHPHHGARSLRSRRTRQLAYVMPRVQLLPGNYIMQQFLQALAAASARRSHSVVVVVPDGDPRDEMRRLIASRTVDAFLLSELQPEDPRVVLLAEAGIPFACFGRIGSGLPQHWVDIDNRAAIVEAVEHVLSRGFSRLAFVGYRGENLWDHERVAGFRAGLARHGVREDEADVLLVDEASARRKIRSLLTGTHRRGAHPGPRPDAIVTGSDRLAAMIYGVAAELRLRIGRDLGVTGFDGSVAAGLLHPRLTSVTIPVEGIARGVIARAMRQLDHGPDEGPGEVLSATLRVGESTGDGPGSDQVRAVTLPAVQDSIDRLGYRPGHVAAAPVRGTPRTVAVLVAHMTRPSTVVRVASALAVLAEEGYGTIVCNVDTPAERDRHLETLPAHRADGVLAISLPLSREQVRQFGRAGVTLVTVDAVTPGTAQTVIDDVAGGRIATGHLIGLGHRRIGFVGDMTFAKPPAGLGFTSSANRLRGYRQALAGAGLGFVAGLVRRGPHDAASAAEHAAQLLKAHDPPTAIFAASDTQAIGVLAAAERLGVTVPGQLSVVGFDDIESAALLGLSTVKQPLARSGTEGAQRLCALLRGERLRVRREKLPLELVARTSTGRRDAP